MSELFNLINLVVGLAIGIIIGGMAVMIDWKKLKEEREKENVRISDKSK